MNKEKIYEDDNFALLKITEVLRLGARASYIPVGMIKSNKVDDEYAVVEYYTKQEKIKKVEPKYERGFEFFIHNFSPVDIPRNVIMAYVPLRLATYKCKINMIDSFENEVSYRVDVTTTNNRELGSCIMKESTIDNIVNR